MIVLLCHCLRRSWNLIDDFSGFKVWRIVYLLLSGMICDMSYSAAAVELNTSSTTTAVDVVVASNTTTLATLVKALPSSSRLEHLHDDDGADGGDATSQVSGSLTWSLVVFSVLKIGSVSLAENEIKKVSYFYWTFCWVVFGMILRSYLWSDS